MPKSDDPIHRFDADGKSVLLRNAVEQENAILRAENEKLREVIATLGRRLSRKDPEPRLPTRH